MTRFHALALAAILAVAVMPLCASASKTICEKNDPGFVKLFKEADALHPESLKLFKDMCRWGQKQHIKMIDCEASQKTPMKGRERACVKCLCKYQKHGGPQLANQCSFGQLRDVVRTTFTFKTVAGLKKFAEGLFANENSDKFGGFKVVQTKNAYKASENLPEAAGDPGYRDIKVMIKMKTLRSGDFSPLVVEVQLQLEPMHDAKTGHLRLLTAKGSQKQYIKGHLAYKTQRLVDEWRDLSTGNKACNAMKAVTKVWKVPAFTLYRLMREYESIVEGASSSSAEDILKTAAIGNSKSMGAVMAAGRDNTDKGGKTARRRWLDFIGMVKSHVALEKSKTGNSVSDFSKIIKKLPSTETAAISAGTIDWLADMRPQGGFQFLELSRHILLQAAKHAYHDANTADTATLAAVKTFGA